MRKKIESVIIGTLAVLLAAAIPASPVLAFSDVTPSDWYYDAVQEAYDNELMPAASDTEFGVEKDLSRAMLSIILYRMAEYPATEYSPVYEDVPDDLYFSQAALWLYEKKVMEPYTEPEEEPEKETELSELIEFYQATTDLNVRAEGDPNAFVLAIVPAGDVVRLLERYENGWSRILWNETEGYVGSGYIVFFSSADEVQKEESSTPVKLEVDEKDRFVPDHIISREELCLYIYRYAAYVDQFPTALRADLSAYSDQEKVSDKAVEAVRWCIETGLLPVKDGLIAPDQAASRADCAWMLVHYREMVKSRNKG